MENPKIYYIFKHFCLKVQFIDYKEITKLKIFNNYVGRRKKLESN